MGYSLEGIKVYLQFAAMAKQLCNYITGTFDDLCFYKMEKQYYVRMKSSLTGKRVKKSPVFKNTMQSAQQLAAASILAATCYRKISKEKRKVQWFRKMTGMAKLLLKNGADEKTILRQLTTYVATVLPPDTIINKKACAYSHQGFLF